MVEGEREGAVDGICHDSSGWTIPGFAGLEITSSPLEIEALALRSALVYSEANSNLWEERNLRAKLVTDSLSVF